MDIKQLRAFVTSVKSGSITTAAHTLRIAQPALSRQIHLLESELGTALLRRSPKGVAPTPAGQVLFDNAADILQRLDRLRGAVAQAAVPSRPLLRVAVPPTLSHRLGTRFLEMCESTCPAVALRVAESWSGYISELLDAGLVDFGVMSVSQVSAFKLRAPILSEELFLVQRRAGPAPDTTPIRVADLHDIELVLPTKLHGVRMLLDETAKAQGIELRVKAEADAWGTIRSIVDSSGYATVMSRREMTDSMQAPAIVFRPIVEPTIKNVFFLVAAENQTQTFDHEDVFYGLAKSIRACLLDDTRALTPA